MDLDIIEPEVQDFSVFRGNSGVSLFLLSFKDFYSAQIMAMVTHIVFEFV